MFRIRHVLAATFLAALALSNPVGAAAPVDPPDITSTNPSDGAVGVGVAFPGNDGGEAITSYTVTASPGGANATGPGPFIGISGLVNGTAYTFTAIATNASGDSPVSAASAPATPYTVPDAPTSPVASAGVITGQAEVSFDAPAFDGGDPVTMYRVTSTPGGFTGSGPASPVGIAGLSNGTSYTFTVAAFNNALFGPESVPSNSVLVFGSPDAPTGVAAVAGQGQATVTWSAPAFDGGDPITSYEVTSSPGAFVATQPDPNTLSAVVTGLTNNTAYTFTVRALNAMGPGTASAPSNSVTPLATAPGVPRTLARAGNGLALVDVVVDDFGGEPVTGFNVTANPGAIVASGATLPITVNGLSNGVLYTFTATATNSIGTSPPSAPSHTVRPFVPGVPASPLVYVPNLDQDDVYVIDSRANVVINRIPVGAVPTGAVVSPVGTRAYVANSLDDTVSVIDTTVQNQVAVVPVGTNPTGIAINPAGTRVYVSNSDSDTVSVIDTSTNTVIDDVPMATQPRGLVVSPDGTRVYVAVGVRVRSIDTTVTPNVVLTSGPLIGTPAGIDITADGTQLSVTNLANLRVNHVNPTTLASLSNTGPTAGLGAGIAIASNGTVYAARNSTDAIAVINGTTVTTTIPVGTAPRGVAITPNGTHAYVTNEGNDTVSVIRLSDNTVVATIPVGFFPGGLGRFIGPAGVPEAPTSASAVAGVASATVTFSAPPYDGGMPVTSYTVSSSIGGFTATGASSPITITGLAHGETYTFTVTATNVSGTGVASAPSNAVTTASAPFPPNIGAVTAGNTQLSVAFTPSGNTGGSPLTGFTVTCTQVSGPGTASASGPASPIVVSGLTNGVAYTCVVRATNAVGNSPPSNASAAATPATLPGPPTIGTATAGNASASVGFTPPASTGGQPITSYTVTSPTPGGITATGPASPIVISGLTNGTAYTFTVKATTASGTGLPSAASNSATPSTIPGAPTIGAATPGNAQASVAFTAPASNGGAAITGYTVTSTPGGFTGTGAASPIVVGGLANGTTYTFRVTATNARGVGPASAASNSVTPSAVPGAPTIGAATAGNNQASVAFTAPASNGGSPITSYTATSNPGGISVSGSASPIVVAGLTAGTAYTFTVTATNANGTGLASAASNAVTPTSGIPVRLVNISTRLRVLTGDDVMIGGFVIGGSVNKTVVVRARGPSLVPAGITDPLLDPTLRLFSGQTEIAANDNFGTAANLAALQASGFAPPHADEAAILMSLAPGPYTAIVAGAGNTVGVGLIEVFEVDVPEVPLINIATRGQVLLGNDVMIAGFIIQGPGQQSIVVRARGPSLTAAGVPGALTNPVLQLVRSSDGVVIASNDDWASAANAAALTASGFAPSEALEAAILISLDPGAYTAIVTGAGGATGVAIVEVFDN